MKNLALLLLGLLVLSPGLSLADLEETTRDGVDVVSQPHDIYRSTQLVRCDESDSITAEHTASAIRPDPVGGTNTCAADDFTPALDCRGMTIMTAHFFEYDASGTAEAKIWHCIDSPGFEDHPVTGANEEAPVTAPSSADPKPLCVDVTAGAGVTMLGTTAGVQELSISGVAWNWLVGEIQACATNDCDSTLRISCSR